MIIDLSQPLSPSKTQIYPTDLPLLITPHNKHAKDGCSVQKLSLGTHTGTHLDAPFHFFKDGKTVDKLELEDLFGEFTILDVSANLEERQRIEWADITPWLDAYSASPMPSIVLIHTGWSKEHYGLPSYYSHPYFAPEVAPKLLELGVRVVGVDTLSPDETTTEDEETKDGFGFHEKFLRGGGIIVENLTNLDKVEQRQGGEKWLISLVPLNIVGADGSPVRAFAVRQDS